MLSFRSPLRSILVSPFLRCQVGTFHKSGTVLWRSILRMLEQERGVRVWDSSDGIRPERLLWHVRFDYHARFADGLITLPSVVTVRDPRAMLLSAARYHVWSKERWLHRPRPEFGGRTYQETIRALPDERSRIRFEMDHATGAELRRMLSLSPHPLLRVVRLEALMQDRELKEFEACFHHLGFRGSLLRHALDCAERSSVFSPRFPGSSHIQSRGSQWREVFDSALSAEFDRRFDRTAYHKHRYPQETRGPSLARV
jgi:hypothetical protein